MAATTDNQEDQYCLIINNTDREAVVHMYTEMRYRYDE